MRVPEAVVVSLLLVAGWGCPAHRAPLPPPSHGTNAELNGAPLVAPAPIDPHVRGAAYLAALAQQIQPAWANFLEDCRTRLPPTHPLNNRALVATVDLVVEPGGTFAIDAVTASGSGDFDAAMRGVLHDARLARPPTELLADDDRAHVRWSFARDIRQAGPATAAILDRDLPVLEVVDRMLAQHALARSARRAQRAIANGDDAATAATERVMIGELVEALDDGDATTRASAISAIGAARLVALAPLVRKHLSPTTSTQLRLAATLVAKDLDDRPAVPLVADSFAADLDEPALARADAAALAALGARADAAKVIAKALGNLDRATPAPTPTQLAALGAFRDAPSPTLVPMLVRAFGRGDARTRAAICPAVAAMPGATGVVVRGLADGSSLVRAACAGAATVKPIDRAAIGALHKLATDRDHGARAMGLVALVVLGAATPAELAAIGDDDREVRWQFVSGLAASGVVAAGASPGLVAALEKLAAAEGDAEIRALAVTWIGARDPDVATAALGAHDAAIRAAAVRSGGVPEAQLDALVADRDAAVATAAFAQLAARRGRVASANLGLARLVGALTAGARVDVAAAWLLAH